MNWYVQDSVYAGLGRHDPGYRDTGLDAEGDDKAGQNDLMRPYQC